MIIEENIRAATCQVRCGDQTGTGWLIASDLVVTAKHCIVDSTSVDDAKPIALEFGLGTHASEHEADLLAVSPELDVAVVRLRTALDVRPLPWSDQLPRPGSRWVAFGRPTAKVDIGHRLEGSIAQILEGLPSAIDIEVAVDGGSALSEYEGFSGAAVVCEDSCIGVFISTADTAVGGISTARVASMLCELGLVAEKTARVEVERRMATRDEFQSVFEAALLAKGTGFVFAEGAPGIGKSTFCEEFEPVSDDLVLIGTYSFSSNDRGLNSTYWSQPEVFEDWLRVLYASTVSATPPRLSQLTYAQLIQSTQSSLSSLGRGCQTRGKTGVVFIDGMNEALRADPSALQRLVGLLPTNPIPGLIVVFTSTNYAQVASVLGSRIGNDDKLSVPGLPRESVAEYCSDELLPEKATPQLIAEICDRAAGHPLYLRYLIDLVNGGASEGDLHQLPAFSGDIEDYYETVWSSIATDESAVHVLGLMARLRWGIPLTEFLSFVDAQKRLAFGAALPRIRHLLAQSDSTAFYHDSFAQFLSAKTALWETDLHDQLANHFRGGLESHYATLNRVYHGLQGGNPSRQRALGDCSQDWVDQCVVLGVAADALLDDIDDTVTVATESGNAVETVRLLLLSQRVRHRYNILFVGAANLAVKALVAMGHSRDALRFIVRQGRLLVPLEEAMAVAVRLVEAGDYDEAYELLEEIDVRVLESLTEKLDTENFIGLVHARTQILVLMLSFHRAPTQQEFPAFMNNVKETIRGGAEKLTRRQSAILTQIDSNFVASMLCFIGQSSKWLQSLPENLSNAFFGSIDGLTTVLLSLREQSELYGLSVDAAALSTLVRKFEEAARKEIAIGPKMRVAVADSLVVWGGFTDVVKALCEEQVETKTLAFTFIKENHALVDTAEFFEAYSFQRLRGYIGATVMALPEVLWGNTNWLATLERLASDLARWDGTVRAAKAAGSSSLGELWAEGERTILPLLGFTLAERVKWEESYAVPELIVPHLYRMLTAVCIDCYPQRLQNLLDMIGRAFERQCGLYTEGFRSLLAMVLELASREATRLGLAPTVMALMTRWKGYVLQNVQNRAELVPELLKMIPLFVNLGATEEASRTYQAVLANSMGPNWYKEDQFSMMVDTLSTFPAEDKVSAEALQRTQSYLDAASGELTFQRFVRYAKQSLLGELCRRGQYHKAVRLFARQMCGTQDELYMQATAGNLDRVSLLVGMRYPGRELDEQAAIIELVEGCMDGANWRTSWALLEIFHDGDDRHLSRWGEAYARIANQSANREGDLIEMSRRLRDLALRRYKDDDKETLFKAFSVKLDPSLRIHFPGLNELAPLSETSIVPEVPVAASSSQDIGAASEGGADAAKQTPTDQDLDQFYLPGTFGKTAALREADVILKLSADALTLGNRVAARTEAIRALEAIQRGGWSIWQDSSSHIRRAESIIDECAVTVQEITQLYGPLLQGERHNFRWVTANRFIERVGGRLGESERGALCAVVLDHIRLLLGDAAPSPDAPTDSAVAEDGAETALFAVLIWALDHPRSKTRHETARMIPWLLREDDGFLRYTLPLACSVQPSNAPDIICGALDVLSRESPARLWERLDAQLQSGVSLLPCRHLGRYAVLRRIARRAVEAGSTTANGVLTAFDESWAAEGQVAGDAELSVIVQAPTNWGGVVKREWGQLNKLGVATSTVAKRVDDLLRQVCEPLDTTTVRELEDLLMQGFATNSSARFGRWEARVRTALHRALFEIVPRERLERLDDVLRISNPSPLLSPIGDRFPLAKFVSAQQNGWKRFKPQDSSQVFLSYQGIVSSDDNKHVLVEVIAFLRPSGGGFIPPPTLQPSFKSTELPRPGQDDSSKVCAFVDPAMAYFGTLTPAILQPRFAQHLGASPTEIHRSVWYEWTDTDGVSDVYSRENAALSVSKSALRLPDGYRLGWLVRFDGKAIATID